jgi:ribonuclease inhibitor
MIKRITLDFDKIHSLRSFYAACKEALRLPDYFGNNLDALWDCITSGISLPAEISFINVTPYHLEKFEKQIELFRDAEEALDGELSFTCETKKDTDAG